jgi:hypothetical protein
MLLHPKRFMQLRLGSLVTLGRQPQRILDGVSCDVVKIRFDAICNRGL